MVIHLMMGLGVVSCVVTVIQMVLILAAILTELVA